MRLDFKPSDKRIATIEYQNDEESGREGYAIKVLGADGEWGLDSFFGLVRREGADDEEEKNFVHWTILAKIAELKRYGYEIIVL